MPGAPVNAGIPTPVKAAEGGSAETTLVQQKGDVNTNIPQAVLDLEKKNKKVEKPKEN
jgi:hypothetical protein